MPNPGYVYLIEHTDLHGTWQKVGVACGIERVMDHGKHGWRETDPRTVGVRHYFLADPRGDVESPTLATFAEPKGTDRLSCHLCTSAKPRTGRSGTDGLTEVRHVDCLGSMAPTFLGLLEKAARADREWKTLSFDPRQIQIPGLSWAYEFFQSPRKTDYTHYPINLAFLRRTTVPEVAAFLSDEYEAGNPGLVLALRKEFGDHLYKRDGTHCGPKKGGTGVNNDVDAVRRCMLRMRNQGGCTGIVMIDRPNDLIHLYQVD